MPTPLSATSTTARSPIRTRSSIRPSKVNLYAFESRLSRICSIISGSASIAAPSSGASTISSSPERSVAERNTAAASRASRPRSTRAKRAVACPASKRERSSSALTRRRRRSAAALGELDPLALGRGIGIRIGERVAERAQHQRERGAELVRHVGEELGLRAVELRQLLGAALGGGEADRARERAGELVGDHAEEVAVALVEVLARAGAEDERGGGHGAAGAGDGQQHGPPVTGARRRGRPGVEHALSAAGGLGRAPPALAVGILGIAGPGEPHVTLLADQVQRGERHVLPRPRQRRQRGVHDGGLRVGRGERIAQRGERLQPPRPDHALARLVHRGEHARHLARVAADRAEGVREVGLLEEAAALQQQRLVLGPGGLRRLDDPLQHRPDLVPDLRPDVAQRHPHRRRVLGAQHRHVGVVVDRDQVGPPEDADPVARLEADRRRRLQRPRPAVDPAQRGAAPLMRPQQSAALAAPGAEAGRWPGGRPRGHQTGFSHGSAGRGKLAGAGSGGLRP